MEISQLSENLVTMGFGAFGAIIGAVLLWKFWAFKRIRGWIFDQGTNKLIKWVENVIEHPDSEDGQRVGRLSGVAFAYILQGIVQDLDTKEGRERWIPIMDVIQHHIQQSIFATFGHLLQKYSSEGEASGLPQHFSVPPFVAGIAQKLMPGVDPGQLIQMVQWLSRMSGGDGGVSSLSPGDSPSGDRRSGGEK